MSGLPARIHTLGPVGTFSGQAALRVRQHLLEGQPDAEIEVLYTRTIPEVVDRTMATPGDWGVIPIENSDTGTVLFAQDAMVAADVSVRLEVNVPVRFSLVGNVPPGEAVVVYSQPVAFDQCSFFVSREMPRAQVKFTNSNTESGALALEHSGEAEGIAAIVPADFGAAHPGLLRAEYIQNYPRNTTRFLALSASQVAPPPDFGRNKTAILVEPAKDYPGLLYDLLSVFKAHNLNLCRLESRPAKITPWTYVFFLDFNNNAGSAEAIAALKRGDQQVRVLGSFDTLWIGED